MLETRAIVVQLDGAEALVQANQGNGCGQCQGKGCGSGKVAQMFCSKPRVFRVKNPLRAAIGDEVIVAVADGAVYQGVGIIYGIPLLLLVLGAVLGYQFAGADHNTDFFAATGAFVGVLLGVMIARQCAAQSAQALPSISKLC